jgi:rhamnose utilization protein RhaD (predicted bifunctional aldolase and dehydrogenase)
MNSTSSDMSRQLEEITRLSHEFGTEDYVRGGGGNTSVKDKHTLWVKPSGTTLATITENSFVALNRRKLSNLYTIHPPLEAAKRETLVKKIMQQAQLTKDSARASVEAPLHNTLSARFVVHTHPAIVNGMTCSINGAQICKKLFPDSLWVDYIDPGYTLCIGVQDEIIKYQKHKGHEPSVIFLKNHGVFVTGETPGEIREKYRNIFQQLNDEYKSAGVSTKLTIAPKPAAEALNQSTEYIKKTVGLDNAAFVTASGFFKVAKGPVSPDHIVYAGSFPFFGEPTLSSLSQYQSKYGYLPHVIAWEDAVFGIAGTKKKATLVLEMAQDGALVKKLATALGGIEYMTDRARIFIENWEVEVYRQQQI